MKKKKEPWGEEERGGGDCLYSNLTRCHYFTYMGLSIPRGMRKNTHSTASGMSGPCQGSARYFIAGFNLAH